MSDNISRADAIEAFDRGRVYHKSGIEEILKALPSAETEPIMMKEVREALMRLTMCAREECNMCKYKDECGYDFQYKISTDNMNTLSDALLRSKCEVDAKSAEAVHKPDYSYEADMARRLKESRSADAVSRESYINAVGYVEWLEELIVDSETFEWLCEDTYDEKWCVENCNYSSIQAECLRHLYEVSKGGDDE